jgi:hypothetical protein
VESERGLDESGTRSHWNVFALVGCIELSRTGKNPPLPSWLEQGYFSAVERLAKLDTQEIWGTDGRTLVQSALGVIALSRGLWVQGELLLAYAEDELEEMLPG